MTVSIENSLSGVRGRVSRDVPLAPRTWFRTGGPADFVFVPEDADDLASALKALPATTPITVLGACSNVIIRDGGIEGVVIRLTRGFSDIIVDGRSIVAGAAALDMTVAEHAATAGIDGLSFLAGIPGSIGGAVVMNAGAYGADLSTVLEWIDIMMPDGTLRRLAATELGFAYRHSILPTGAIVLRARLTGRSGDPGEIRAHIAEIKAAREAAQPIRARTGGSTFRNPSGEKAWALIDAAGCRGLRIGDAQISEKHCNFMLNLGAARSMDLEQLGETVRDRVRAQSGIDLHWEIKRLGRQTAENQA
ncbi:UDP-N-acetylenolpyruvoylglucosamine reductase [Neoasaia chiangmaiensis NBRC 101099]|uniref:UDP-N-acetylenolpyruvoylglucosamine reductase n=1 Tax=Neoasaia chiangmaiensis TaxID=320497 RepID=A0A1U9KT23_9PROT|nr:UDP-N-acetylmuramate dehydrogenase [Neoasaia chiangmaiensis]AQS88889.1 UDP-N-acetylenolpyruvoylglucosamine reductase [Neoasaia chiangmaiensis]GBR40478.1 UDP-N-acetylenolpyruvoylglucosamine reductase [Neoasaia chiangmaiensis NBRC 101099]GEN13880.1 UDP-N-acetylenolpyruvoylglucosamine reductase [Neoasaia chiangmaiensis]